MCGDTSETPIASLPACFRSALLAPPCILSLKHCVRWSLCAQIKQEAPGRLADINACDWEIESSRVVNLNIQCSKRDEAKVIKMPGLIEFLKTRLFCRSILSAFMASVMIRFREKNKT